MTEIQISEISRREYMAGRVSAALAFCNLTITPFTTLHLCSGAPRRKKPVSPCEVVCFRVFKRHLLPFTGYGNKIDCVFKCQLPHTGHNAPVLLPGACLSAFRAIPMVTTSLRDTIPCKMDLICKVWGIVATKYRLFRRVCFVNFG